MIQVDAPQPRHFLLPCGQVLFRTTSSDWKPYSSSILATGFSRSNRPPYPMSYTCFACQTYVYHVVPCFPFFFGSRRRHNEVSRWRNDMEWENVQLVLRFPWLILNRSIIFNEHRIQDLRWNRPTDALPVWLDPKTLQNYCSTEFVAQLTISVCNGCEHSDQINVIRLTWFGV